MVIPTFICVRKLQKQKKSGSKKPGRGSGLLRMILASERKLLAPGLVTPGHIQGSLDLGNGHTAGARHEPAGDPNGSRTRVSRVRTWYPRPLDDGTEIGAS